MSAARRRSAETRGATNVPWSPYSHWAGDLPAEPCEIALYALLWLDSVAVTGPAHLYHHRCSLLAEDGHWQRVCGQRSKSIPMRSVVAAARKEACRDGGAARTGAMAVLGGVVYAWAQYDLIMASSPSAWQSWRGAELNPKQLLLYLESCLDPGKRGARLRANGGKVYRWDIPEIEAAYKTFLFDVNGVHSRLLALLSVPLSISQARVFERYTASQPCIDQRNDRNPSAHSGSQPVVAVARMARHASQREHIEINYQKPCALASPARSAPVRLAPPNAAAIAIIKWRARAAWRWQLSSCTELVRGIALKALQRRAAHLLAVWRMNVERQMAEMQALYKALEAEQMALKAKRGERDLRRQRRLAELHGVKK